MYKDSVTVDFLGNIWNFQNTYKAWTSYENAEATIKLEVFSNDTLLRNLNSST